MGSTEVTKQCAFRTDRLEVGEWHAMADHHGLDLETVVSDTLTPQTTRALPPEWHGGFDIERSRRWIEDRDAESATLLAVEHETGVAACLLLLFESVGDDDPGFDLRIGYIVRDTAAGRGLASELVGGLVEWARSQPSIGALSGGVSSDNAASARVLLKNGFAPVPGPGSTETFYELRL
jgi:RimJ/RimL family protein N-acetyltransferase